MAKRNSLRRKETVEILDVKDLEPDPTNPRKHTARNVSLIVDSLRELGAGRSVLIDKSRKVIAGNGVREAMIRAGIRRVKVVDTDRNTVVAVRRRDLKGSDSRRMSLMDNRASELGEWDPAILSEILAGEEKLLEGVFKQAELDKILAGKDGSPETEGGPPEMEILPFEHYDYIVLMFRNSLDYTRALDTLQIGRASFTPPKGKAKIGLGRVVDGPKALRALKAKRNEAP